jgi:ribosomal protein S18 acetylase RimI-like enzyme
MIIRNLKETDCSAVAKLHSKGFRSFFLTKLGERFLRKFYKAILSHPEGIALGLFNEGEMYAFAVGSLRKRGFYSSLIKHNFLSLSLACLPTIIANPTNILRILKSLTTKDTANVEIGESASLLSICVNPEHPKSGFGQQILFAFEEKAFSKKKLISLTTDAHNNYPVNSFYKKNGYLLDKYFNQGNRIMNLYIKRK